MPIDSQQPSSPWGSPPPRAVEIANFRPGAGPAEPVFQVLKFLHVPKLLFFSAEIFTVMTLIAKTAINIT